MLATVLISLALAAILGWILRNLIKAKKKGKPSCSCGCGSCGGICRKFTEQLQAEQEAHKS